MSIKSFYGVDVTFQCDLQHHLWRPYSNSLIAMIGRAGLDITREPDRNSRIEIFGNPLAVTGSAGGATSLFPDDIWMLLRYAHLRSDFTSEVLSDSTISEKEGGGTRICGKAAGKQT